MIRICYWCEKDINTEKDSVSKLEYNMCMHRNCEFEFRKTLISMAKGHKAKENLQKLEEESKQGIL